MKTLNLSRLLLLPSIFLFSSCQQEDLENHTPPLGKSEFSIEYLQPPAGAKYYASGMLSFVDIKEFLATIEELEELTISYEENFMSMWGHLSEDELDKKMDELNYDSRQPLIDF